MEKNINIFFLLIILLSFNVYSQNDTIRIKKEILKYDTIAVYDTVFVDEFEDEYLDLYFSVDVFYSPMFISNTISNFNFGDDFSSYLDFRNKSETFNVSHRIGFLGNVYLGSYGISTGISFSFLSQDYNYDLTQTQVDKNITYDIMQNTEWEVEVIDTFYQVTPTDTNMIIVTDSTQITSYDSTEIIRYDTTKTGEKLDGTNKFRYLEIPLIANYTFYVDKFDFTLKSGLITSLLIHENGKSLMAINPKEVSALNDIPYAKIGFSIYLGIKARYNYNEAISIFAETYYIKSIKSSYEKNFTLKQYIDRYGLKLGVEYFF